MSALDLEPVWALAEPLSGQLYDLTEGESFHEHRDLRAHLRRAMGSAMSCLRDAQAHLESQMACAYLGGAERMIQQVVDDLALACNDGYLASLSCERFIADCKVLGAHINEILIHLPEGSRNTVAINDYASLYLPRSARPSA